MSHSLTWQFLPDNLLDLVLQQHLMLWEAAWLLDEWLLTPEGCSRTLPPELHPAAERMHLLSLPASPTRH